MFSFLNSCWQFEKADPTPTPAPNATGHGRPILKKSLCNYHKMLVIFYEILRETATKLNLAEFIMCLWCENTGDGEQIPFSVEAN